MTVMVAFVLVILTAEKTTTSEIHDYVRKFEGIPTDKPAQARLWKMVLKELGRLDVMTTRMSAAISKKNLTSGAGGEDNASRQATHTFPTGISPMNMLRQLDEAKVKRASSAVYLSYLVAQAWLQEHVIA
mmetsp:Transcript_43313/g.82641  ORF Transcript_43313/g.82641 Transcript_43313/m.82641 type:complete len:130 (+) Transcript_43313:3063-3452(+)